MIAQHVFEGLYTFDATYSPVPMLAEGAEMSDDGLVAVITLREGVMFHNGEEMDSGDVVASLERWGEFGTRGPVLFDHVESVEATGDYEVTMTFAEPFAPWKNLLAFINGGPVVYPEEIVADAGAEPIPESDYIGTGPYEFAERNSGRYISLTRFDDYSALSGAPDGYAGERVAYFDEIRFIPVPEVGTRVSGVQAGDYHYAEQISGDLYGSLDANASVETIVNQGALQGLMFFNSRGGIMQENWKLRQAILAATDMTAVLKSAIGADSLWQANGSIMPEGTAWYTDEGVQYYPDQNIEAAQRLADEAGYDGETIRFMASSSYQMHYDSTQVIAQQLEEAGFNVDLQIYDWPTLASRRSDPELWDIFFTHHGFVPDPILYTFMSESYPGWWTTEEKRELAAEFSQTLDTQERMDIWADIQSLVYEQIPIIKTGDIFNYDIYTPELQGLGETQLIWPKFWGVWVE
jgi:peptide/nickel transport system substrate-binding protein